MVSFKGKPKANQTRSFGTREFKVYSDKSHIVGVVDSGKSFPAKEENSQPSGSDNLKKCCGVSDNKSKSRLDTSVKVKAGRKALADVSNVSNTLSSNQQTDGFRPRKSLPAKKENSQLGSSDLKKRAGTSEKTKSLHDGSVKVKVGRRPLADVSNVRNIFSRARVNDGAKPVKISEKNNPCEPRVLVRQRSAVASVSSRRSVTGTRRQAGGRGTGLPHSFKKNDTRDTDGCFQSQKTNDQGQGKGHESFVTDGRKFVRKPPTVDRKSLPVLRSSNMIASSDSKGGSGISVNIKVERKEEPDVTNGVSHFWKNRASDGFMSVKGKTGKQPMSQRVPARQNVIDPGMLPKKSIRPFGRATFPVTRNQMVSKSKLTTGLKTTFDTTAKPSTTKKKSLTQAIPKYVDFVVSHKDCPQKLPCDDSSGTNMDMRSNSSTVNCSRRQSFTSSLVAKSEALKVCGKYTEKEGLPCIDDSTNHLEVAEYVDEIYRYYWVMEAQYPSMANYMDSQTSITPKMRGILVNWLIEVHLKFELMQETLFLMVALFDRFVSVVSIEKEEIQLVGLTALLLASKYEDFWHPKVKDLISIAAGSYTRDEMLAMEKTMLKKLMFRLNIPTPYVFMLRFLKAGQSEKKVEHLAYYLIELCLVEYEALKYKPSMLCASAIYVARKTLEITPAWSPLLSLHSHYEESDLRCCADMIIKFQKAAGKGQLKVSYEKHMSLDHSWVAAVKPLNKLPQ